MFRALPVGRAFRSYACKPYALGRYPLQSLTRNPAYTAAKEFALIEAAKPLAGVAVAAGFGGTTPCASREILIDRFHQKKENPITLAVWGFQPKPYHNAGEALTSR